jgi:CBS domain-containing protein
MKVEEVMTRDPKTITSDQNVSDAVSIMKSENCGIVPVVEAGASRIVGVVTDRDIALGSCNSGGTGPNTPISSVMTSSNLFCVDKEEDLSEVCKMMERAGVRRVPVVEDGDKLVGIISMKDLAENLGEKSLGETDQSILQQKPNN